MRGNKHAVLTLLTAASERVSDVSWQAGARWDVVDHLAESVEAARSRARVVAYVVSSTGKCPGTVRVDDTFRPAASEGVSKVLWATGAQAAASASN